VFDVLFLLSVSGRFFQGPDDKGGCGRNDGDSSLSVLDGESDCDAQAFLKVCQSKFQSSLVRTYPVAGCLCDIFTDLLRRQTEGTDLGSESG
jgi:hypothetical protein